MGKVYIGNLGGHDYSDAKRYGDLVFLTAHGYNPKDLDRIAFQITDKLQHFDEETDYFLPVGQDIVNLTALYFLSQRHEFIRILYWDFKREKYIVQEYSPQFVDRVYQNQKLKQELIMSDV